MTAPGAATPAPVARACLVDVYDTILASRLPTRQRQLAALAGIDPDAWFTEWLALARERDTGVVTVAESFARTIEACGLEAEPALVKRLVEKDAELLAAGTRVYDDTVPFFSRLRSGGIRVALVSNCADNTRPMLTAKGLLGLADAAVLSCEAGMAKPDPEIYLLALEKLGAAPAEAVMFDDKPAFCAGAEAVGARAIQVLRADGGEPGPDGRFPAVSSLLDALPLL